MLWQQSGLHNVGSYQVAGRPWLTASLISPDTTLTCSFPYVTKQLTVYNTGSAPVVVHFADADSNPGAVGSGHYLTIPANANAASALSRFTFDVKCKSVYITVQAAETDGSGVEVYASLTGIVTASMYPLSGDGLNG